MVLIFNNLSCSATRFIGGVDAILEGDILYIKDKLGRERIFYLGSTGGKPYYLSGIDIASGARYVFESDTLSIMDCWPSGVGHAAIPAIKEWEVLYESGLQGRSHYRSVLLNSFACGEMLLNTITDEFLTDGEFDPIKLLSERARASVFCSFSEKITGTPELLEKYENRFIPEIMEPLRASIPRRVIQDIYDQSKGAVEMKISAIFPDFDLERGPYKPLKQFLADVKDTVLQG